VDVRGVKGESSASGILDLQASYDTLNEIAKQTGGKAFYSTNDVKSAMKESLDHGGTYYTLAYAPTNHKWNSNYRHIKINLNRADLSAEYRPGYYASAEQPSSPDEDRVRLVAALQPTVPESTMLLLRAQVLAPDTQSKSVRIDCGVYAPDIRLSEDSAHVKHGELEFIAVAWKQDNTAASNTGHDISLIVKPEEYASVMEHGVAAHLDLNLKPGTYKLRIGVMDNGSHKIGTLDVPLIVDAAKEELVK
jgi:hypothetical protein